MKRKARDADLADAIHEMRLAYRDPDNSRCAAALDRLRVLARNRRQLSAAAGRAFELAIANGPRSPPNDHS
jgi:hypothetical protein